MNRLWRALAFLAAAGTALFLSTAALAVGGGSSQPQAKWKVALGPATWSGKLTALYPGAPADTEVFAVRIANASNSVQVLHSVEASMQRQANGDAETAAGMDIQGCRASWFAVSVDHAGRPLFINIAPGTSYTAKVDLTMRASGSNQDECRAASPAFTVTSR